MRASKRYLPHFTVFLSAMGIMIVELVASRIISKYFGNSLYTWTGVIGVVLGGISLGNYIGGKLSDRYDPEKLISVLLLISSFLVFLILLLDMLLEHSISAAGVGTISAALIIRSVLLMVILFFLPATSLGTISPAMAKLALLRSNVIGGTVGSIWAVSSAGSIVGTFLSGYLFIPFFGVRTIIFSVSPRVLGLSTRMIPRIVMSAFWIDRKMKKYRNGSSSWPAWFTTCTARKYFGIRESGITVIVNDGRGYVRSLKDGKQYGIVYLDAFNSFSIPAHLTTADFLVEVADHLSEDGIVLANTIDFFKIGKFLNAYHQTMKAVYPEVAVYVPAGFTPEYRTTFVFAAAKNRASELPDNLFNAACEPIAYRMEKGLLRELKKRNGAIVLRDDYAPVENLIGPVFLASVGE